MSPLLCSSDGTGSKNIPTKRVISAPHYAVDEMNVHKKFSGRQTEEALALGMRCTGIIFLCSHNNPDDEDFLMGALA